MLRKLPVLTLFIGILFSCTSVAQAPSVPDALYAGTGTPAAQTSATGAVSDTKPGLPPGAMGDLRLTVLIDNTAYKSGLRSEWGFAALVEYGGHTLLFDTGASGSNLLGNMRQLGVDPRSIEAIVLSHEHNDHTKGLKTLLETGVRPPVYVPSAFTTAFKDRVRDQTKLIEVSGALGIFPGVHTTRPIGSIVEQALVVETRDGTVVITGCAHPGIVQIVRQAQAVVRGEISLLAGGFHLLRFSENQLIPIIAELQRLGVKRVMPTHCTGEKAIALFRTSYGENFVEGGVGRTVTIPAK
jgi:7,8-dihydropterin-6-yl-methyl-4-(beta-D-ribofuranosyl)aminobenzene 5'-phosphate synthase